MSGHDRLPTGHRLSDRYVVEELIGVGATSAVYRALDLRTRSVVALKVLDPFLANDAVSLERFSREMQLLRGVSHPHVVRVYSLEEDDGLTFLAMEHIAGQNLRGRLEQKGRLPPVDVVRLARSLASALDACHRLGVVHRDVTPRNVLLTASMEPTLVDFGIAGVCGTSHLTRTGTYLGTPDYMAPEQFQASTPDPRSDLYSLGVLLYELLTERLPYAAGSMGQLLGREAQNLDPPSFFFPDIPSWLDAIVLKCLRTSCDDRYQSAYELERDLGARDRSLAQYGDNRETCINCREDMLPRLSFCQQCGALRMDHFERGSHAVILYRCDDEDDFAHRIASLLPGVDRASVQKRLRHLPRVLFPRLSEQTARSLASELFGARAELGVSERLPRELRLPKRYLFYAAFGLPAAAILVNAARPAGLVVAVAMTWAMLFGLYWARVRPLVSASNLPKERTEKRGRAPLPWTRALAQRISGLRHRGTKELLAKIARGVDAIPTPTRSEELRALVDRAITAGETMERCELYLSGRSLVELMERRESAEKRLMASRVLDDVETIVASKTSVERDIRTYRELRDLHTRLHFALLNLNRSLAGLENEDGGALTFEPEELDPALLNEAEALQ